ncbi:unnamed protein product [Orchesella dallaii]|uniref:Mutator-like transposase domain-containing protein n=1 Tax=Orchesella dallaii TaxID=48710 RepID=A0ABP1R4V0_9HEXA
MGFVSKERKARMANLKLAKRWKSEPDSTDIASTQTKTVKVQKRSVKVRSFGVQTDEDVNSPVPAFQLSKGSSPYADFSTPLVGSHTNTETTITLDLNKTKDVDYSSNSPAIEELDIDHCFGFEESPTSFNEENQLVEVTPMDIEVGNTNADEDTLTTVSHCVESQSTPFRPRILKKARTLQFPKEHASTQLFPLKRKASEISGAKRRKTPPSSVFPSHVQMARKYQSQMRKSLHGRRVLSLESLINTVGAISKHKCDCSDTCISFKTELKTGLETIVVFNCVCKEEFKFTSNSSATSLPINRAFVWATQASATGFYAAETFLSILDVPSPCWSAFKKQQDSFHKEMMDAVMLDMAKWGAEEAELESLK